MNAQRTTAYTSFLDSIIYDAAISEGVSLPNLFNMFRSSETNAEEWLRNLSIDVPFLAGDILETAAGFGLFTREHSPLIRNIDSDSPSPFLRTFEMEDYIITNYWQDLARRFLAVTGPKTPFLLAS